MNQLNENLRVIRRQKAIYRKMLECEPTHEEKTYLEDQIKILNEHEYKILQELGVKI